jgi:hypothetical protein
MEDLEADTVADMDTLNISKAYDMGLSSGGFSGVGWGIHQVEDLCHRLRKTCIREWLRPRLKSFQLKAICPTSINRSYSTPQ